MKPMIPLTIVGLTLAACGDNVHLINATDGCNGESSPYLEGSDELVRCGPQAQSPSGTDTDLPIFTGGEGS